MEEIGVLTPPQLSRLRKAFLDSSGLSKAAFVAAMMQIIGPRALAPRDSNTSPELATAAALVDVFDAVDINHDGTVDWEEFSVYYLAHGSTRGPALLRLKHRLNERYGFEGSTPHTTNVTRVRYIPELQKLFVCEEGSKSLKVHEAAVMRVDDGMPLLGEVNLRGADALDVAFAPTPRLLLVACADFAIKLFDAAPLMPSVRRFKGLMASVYRKLRYMRGNAADAPGADAVATGEDELMEALAAQAAAEEARLRRRRMQAGAAVKDYLPMKLLGFAHTPTVQKTLAWHGEGEQLISSGLDEHILVWKVRLIKSSPTAKVAHIVQTGVLAGHTATVNDVLVIPQHGPPPGRAASGPNGEVPVGEVLLEADDDGLTSASTTQVGTGDAEAGNTPVTPVATTPAPDPRGNATPSFVDAAAASALSPEPAAKVGFLVSTSSDTTVRIWKYANDRISLVRVSRRHSQSVQFARFARLPRMLLTAGLDNFIQCFDMSLDDGTAVMKLVGHTSPITGLATIPSRAQAVSVDENGFVRWWNVCRDASVLDEERCLQVVRPASATVSPFLPRGLDVVHSLPTMAARTMGTSWEGLTLIRIGHALAAGGMAAGAQLTEQMDALRAAGSQVAGAGDDGTPTEAADSISTSSGSFATSGDGSPGGRPMAAATRASAAIAAAARRAALPHGSVIVAGSRLKCFETVAVTDEASVPVLVNAAPELGSIIAVLERDARVVSAGDGSLRHYFEEVGGGVVACAARAVDSRVLFVGMSSGRVHAVNLGTGARLLELPPHRRDVCAVIPCPADSLAITASWDRTLRVVDLLAASQCIPVQVADSSGAVASAPQAYQSAAEPPAAAGAGAPSPETGLQLVDESGCEASAPRSCHVAAMDMSMLRFQTSLERPLETSPSVLREVQSAMPAAITCAAVSLETALIATGDAQGNLRLWTFDTMNAAGRAVGHQAEVHAASFVPKALALVSGDSSGVVLVWDTHARLAKGTDMLRCVMAFRAAVAPGPKPTPFAPREAVGVVAEDVQGATFDTARSHMSTGPISTRAVPSDSPAAARLGVDGPEEVALPPLQQGSGDDIASLLALKTLRGKAIVVAGTESGKICVWDVSEALQRTTAFRTERLPPAQLSFEPRRSAYGTVRDDPDCDPRLWQASLPAMRLRAQWQHQLREASDIARTEVKLLCLFEAHSAGAVTCLSFQAMPDTLLSGGGRGEIRAWDLTVCDADVPRDHGSESDEVDDGDQKEPISPGAPALAKRRFFSQGAGRLPAVARSRAGKFGAAPAAPAAASAATAVPSRMRSDRRAARKGERVRIHDSSKPDTSREPARRRRPQGMSVFTGPEAPLAVGCWPWDDRPQGARPRIRDGSLESLPGWGLVLTTPNAPPAPLKGQWRFPLSEAMFAQSRAAHAQEVLRQATEHELDAASPDASRPGSAASDAEGGPGLSKARLAIRRAHTQRMQERKTQMRVLRRMLGLEDGSLGLSADQVESLASTASRPDGAVRAAELMTSLSTPRAKWGRSPTRSSRSASRTRPPSRPDAPASPGGRRPLVAPPKRSVLSGDDSAKGGPWDPERGARRHDVVATMLRRGRPPGDEDPSAALSLAFLGGMPAQSASDATDMSEDWWSDEQMRRSLSKRSTVDDPLGADDDFTRSNLRRMLKQEAQDLAISQSQMLPARFVVNHSMAASPQQKAAQLAAAVRRTLNVSGTELSMAKVPGWSDRGSKHRYPAMTHEQNRRNAAARSAAAHVLMTTAPADVAEELRAASMEARREALLDADAVLDMAMAPSEFLKSHLGDEAQLKSLARPGSSVPPLSTRRGPKGGVRPSTSLGPGSVESLQAGFAPSPGLSPERLKPLPRAAAPGPSPGKARSSDRRADPGSPRHAHADAHGSEPLADSAEAATLISQALEAVRLRRKAPYAAGVVGRKPGASPSKGAPAAASQDAVFGMRIEKHRALSVRDTREIAAQAVLQEEFKQSLARDAAKRRARSRQLSAALSAADPSQPIPDGLRKLGAEELASQARGAAEGPRPVDAAVVANDSRFGGRGISQRSGVNALRRALIDVTTDLAGDDDALRLDHQRRLRMRLRRIDPLEAMFAPDGPGPGPDAPSGASLATRKMFGPYKRMDIAAFRKVIQRIDQDGDRVITRQEFLADPFVTNDDTLGARMESIYRSLDRDGSGNVTVVQFARAMFPMADAPTLRDILAFCFWHPTVREEQDVMRAKYSSRTLGDLRRLFLLYDTDSGGTISRDELLEALRAIHKGNSRATRNIYEQASSMQSKAAGLAIIETQLDSIMARADTDGNDELDFEEFVGLMGPTFEPTAPIVPDIDGRYRPKLEVEISELVEDEEDPLEAALAVAKERRAEAVHEKGRGRSEADSAAGDDEWSVDL
ncbi:hypothetical protein FNF28_01403 [Cafeteria roenbergensis]|uniref:EF-hand domain-containing protein n=1 Tax=Cafeteria roenbergensis TaxID=33653 RepID=A0A5A8DYW5_CAFRO|nr:hypothetical protein FNF28_01403 [Cafeteria roenbergensis]